MNILSVCIYNSQIEDKNNWLDKYAPFFKKENRNILSKESYPGITSAQLKVNFLKNLVRDSNIKLILIDDDNEVLKAVSNSVEDIIIFQDSSIID